MISARIRKMRLKTARMILDDGAVIGAATEPTRDTNPKIF
jgi:hypothetical protein